MDFALSPKVEEARLRIRHFVEEEILPLEADPANYDAHENIAHAPLERLKAKAKEEGLWSLSLPGEWGGLGFTMAEIAPCYVFLASDEASYISGQVLHPNGGNVVGS